MPNQQRTTIDLFKEEMKFSAGHFTIFSADQRENLHGHNFTVQVSLTGEVDDNGMLADYGRYKRLIIQSCQRWNETFMLPGESPHLKIERDEAGDIVARFAGETLRFLARDVTILPIRNVTLEELARHFGELLIGAGDQLRSDRVSSVRVKCSSGPGQLCSWSWPA
ncbi:6-pyruvoyl trahydropterin synthase family protein [Nannocystaceae bacterium ST9]